MTETFDQLVHRTAEDHLNACLEAMDAAFDPDVTTDAPDPAYGAFCGCTTCTVREILSVTWDLMEAEARRRVLAEMKQEQHRRIEQFGPRSDNAALPHPTEIEDLCDAED